jgi:hypothetical protein
MTPPLTVPLSVGPACGGHIRAATQTACGFSATSVRLVADAAACRDHHPSSMSRSGYAVWWQEGDTARRAGKLLLGPLHLLLSANGTGRLAIALDEIVSVDYARGELEIARRDGPLVRIGNLDGVGALLELSDALAA